MRVITCIYILVLLAGCFNKEPETTKLKGKEMPSFDILLPDGLTKINTSSIPEGKPIVLFKFAPWCPYCKLQTEELVSQVNSLKNIRFYFITSTSFPEFKMFYDHYKLNNYENITAGQDSSYYLSNYLQTDAIPCFAIYDENKKLKRILTGKSSIKLLKDIAQEQ